MNRLRIKDFIMPVIMLITSIIVFIIYLNWKGFHIDIFLQIWLSFLATLIIPIFNILSKKIKIPLFINGLITINLILAMLLGSALRFYDKILIWDKICHSYFGFEVACIFLFFASILKIEKIHIVPLLILMMTFTLGLASIWEMGEFFMDSNFGTDFQNINRSVELGLLPQDDTMWDIIVAAIGDIVFSCVYCLDRYLLNYKLLNLVGFNLSNNSKEN